MEDTARTAELRAQFKISNDRCVGCFLGDDAPEMHTLDWRCLTIPDWANGCI